MLEIRKLVDEIQKSGKFNQINKICFKYLHYSRSMTLLLDLSGSSQGQKENQCKIAEDQAPVKR